MISIQASSSTTYESQILISLQAYKIIRMKIWTYNRLHFFSFRDKKTNGSKIETPNKFLHYRVRQFFISITSERHLGSHNAIACSSPRRKIETAGEKRLQMYLKLQDYSRQGRRISPGRGITERARCPWLRRRLVCPCSGSRWLEVGEKWVLIVTLRIEQ